MNVITPLGSVIAHHTGPDPETGHGQPFHKATIEEGKSATHYFQQSGIRSFAESHGGLCTFWLGDTLGLYQSTNEPLVVDEALAPSTDTNRALFGDFMGTLHGRDTRRRGKREIVERSLGNGQFVRGLDPYIRALAENHLQTWVGRTTDTATFAISLVAHVDSYVPGVLDLSDRPLTEFLNSKEHGRVAVDFFEIASDVISNMNPEAMQELDVIVPFVRELLIGNADAIRAAPDSNLIKKQFALWGHEFDVPAIEVLSDNEIKELGTVIVAVYDTTALSLTWLIDYLENSPDQKTKLLSDLHRSDSQRALSVAEQCVLEAVRLGGSNPTALWRRTIEPVVLTHEGRSVEIPVGTMLWLDRWQANRDPTTFPNPERFDTGNVRELVRSSRETASSLLSRNRYEINSFSMVNTRRNPRKCPGRLFSVQVQSSLLAELYGNYDVSVDGSDLALKSHSAMPRPYRSGSITISPKSPREKTVTQ